MRPHGFDEVQQLEYARARAEMLREEWRLANSPAAASRVGVLAVGAVRRLRRAAGTGLLEVARRLLPADADRRRAAVNAGGPDAGC